MADSKTPNGRPVGLDSPLPRLRVGWVLSLIVGGAGTVAAVTLLYAKLDSRGNRMEEIVQDLGANLEKGLGQVRSDMVSELRQIGAELKRQDGAAHERGKQLGILEERLAHQDERIRRLESKIDEGK